MEAAAVADWMGIPSVIRTKSVIEIVDKRTEKQVLEGEFLALLFSFFVVSLLLLCAPGWRRNGKSRL
jgi:hypothetical protein